MKIKDDFTTNSSSSSFLIRLEYITAEQRNLIYAHADKAGDDAWRISEDFKYITGFTYMDNFDMADYLEKIGIPNKAIEWEKGY